jgi:hypothetical protein
MTKAEESTAAQLARAHAALLKDLRQLEEEARTGSRESLAELRDRLAATRTDITDHFRFEETNGYMDRVRKREPRLDREIDRLGEEHRELGEALRHLIQQAETTTNLTSAFQKEILGWIERVRLHEARENDLVQDAFNLDMGPED